MQYKHTPTGIKDLDEKQGIVEAYANVYHNEDADGDISMPGSFKKTVKEQSKRIRVLKDHISTQMIGVPIEMDAEDPKGLRTVTEFNMKKDLARDMFTDIQLMIKHNKNAELSIGYEIVKRNEKNQKKVEEYKLYEYSFLSNWAANELATVEGIKSFEKKTKAIELLQEAYDLDYSDQRLKQIESILKSLDGEPEPSTPSIEPVESKVNNLITNLTLNNKSFLQ